MTTETKAMHTPGPWAVGRLKSDIGTIITLAAHIDRRFGCSINASQCHDTYQAPIAWAGSHGHHFSMEEAEANARLIAAAPELLTALDELVSAIADLRKRYDAGDMPAIESNMLGAAYRQAIASIAKAQGRTL